MNKLFGETANLDEVADKISSAIAETTNTEIRQLLEELRKNIREMQVSKLELALLKEEYQVGDVTPDTYYDRRKKLTRSYYRARDRIQDQIVPTLIRNIKDEKVAGRLSHVWKSIKSEINLATAIINLISALLKFL